MTVDVELLPARHPLLFFGGECRVEGFDSSGVLTAIGSGGGNIHPLPPVKRARNKLRHEQSRWEVALTHKADVLLFEAHKSTADIVAGIPQIDVHVVTHLARDFKGMLNQELVLLRLNKSLYSSFWYTSLPFSFSIPYIVNKVEL